MRYFELNKDELLKEKCQLETNYDELKKKKMKLDMSRGKPCTEQLDLSNDILSNIDHDFNFSGFDVRNYGCLEGLPEIRKIMSDLMGSPFENTMVCGNSSLSLMHDVISNFFIKGSNGCKPWSEQKIKFLCPSPGYDRHFQMCEFFGIEMIQIKLNKDGPDMNVVESLVSKDSSIKGIWCVPKYSNPEGIVYSDEVVERFANLSPKADDFKIFWDNAYSVHDLHDYIELPNIFEKCKKSGKEDAIISFGSTSKITFASAGISAIGCLGKNFEDMKKYFSKKIVSFDKLNQARHIKFLKNFENIKNHMKKHASILKPKFDLILDKFDREFGENNILRWTCPRGGYFISVYSYGSASRIEKLCSDAGLSITPAGASYPYGKDEDDSNIRIAPSYPSIEELKNAMEIFCLCVKISSIEKILRESI